LLSERDSTDRGKLLLLHLLVGLRLRRHKLPVQPDQHDVELRLVHASPALGAKYRLKRQLDRGGMGSVWEAEHVLLGSSVAVKLMDTEIAAYPEAVSRFLREAQAAAALRSPHVVQILDYGIDGEVPFIVMELLEGESLAARLRRGALPAQQAALLLTDVARALSKAHDAGIVHRDLKPENVFIIRNDDQELAKVLDFGIAKTTRSLSDSLAAEPDAKTDSGALLGTPNYMSPEQALGSKELDYRTDIWSFGVMAFECLTAHRPFQAETVGKLLVAICTEPLPVPSSLAAVPPGFDAWFAKACARSASERFQSAREAMTELRGVCECATPAPSSLTSPAPLAAALTHDEPTQHEDAGTSAFRPRKSRTLLVVVVLLPVVAIAAYALRGRELQRGPPSAVSNVPHESPPVVALPPSSSVTGEPTTDGPRTVPSLPPPPTAAPSASSRQALPKTYPKLRRPGPPKPAASGDDDLGI
jgi:eukaryotic-like serine/threonine-protein kinase